MLMPGAIPRRIAGGVAGKHVGPVRDAAHYGRLPARSAAQTNLQTEIGKMKAGPEHDRNTLADERRW